MPPSGATYDDASGQPAEHVPARLRTDIPSPARTWNYWLGGKDNYEVDRKIGDATAALNPDLIPLARQSRRFLIRVVNHLASEAGIRNFLDIGAGLPIEPNTHEVAQRVAPDARVLYVDNDPMVRAHAHALMRGTTPEGTTDFLDADYHDPRRILAAAADVLNFDEPIAVMFMGVMGFCQEYETAKQIVSETMAGVPSGSHLVLWDCTDTSELARQSTEQYAESGTLPYILRSVEQLDALFDGLEKVDPGMVSISQWRPNPTQGDDPTHVDGYGAVARKP
ncbi:S-adenosyl methyltransferase [Actinomadura pelletieri DSM 43383]|uniref:S-adenosyl methyltransferase n=1 Tax=Actinomadura pelletieri DSM 43383 TaxID=1120940 RepID=A0A495QN10_9ACTN|nr:SAM-dependent methyltransferase [Actinomadura pelletieri]RKS74331.1 S-adenosyl methyltransferase [Actinomadura pelletieri DSM 43383]